MRQGKQFGLSAMQKSDMWRSWKAGQSLHEIGLAMAAASFFIPSGAEIKTRK